MLCCQLCSIHYTVGMGDIGFLAYDYCHEQISQLSRLLPTYWKYYTHYELSIKMVNLMTFHWILEKVICNSHDNCRFRLSPVKEKYTTSIIANKIITIAHPYYTAVRINNCLKITSAITVAPMKITDDFHHKWKPSHAYHKIDTFHGEQRWMVHKGGPW